MTAVELLDRVGLVVGYTQVDAGDEESIRAVGKWYRTSEGYAAHRLRDRILYLHRLLLNLDFGDPTQGDHINRDRLDNRRENLRPVRRALNQQNVPARTGTSSKFRGVSWEKRQKKWRAYANVNGKYVEFGRFDSEDEAGEVARINRMLLHPGAVD